MHLKDAHVTELPDFIVVEEFHAARAFIKVVAEGDAAVPVLDLAGVPTKKEKPSSCGWVARQRLS